ncbi:MAG: hypothetical protein D6813_10765 [Calditrichaeota bacterium]|nr:MAG: hypothetical protein D6813_10765 [Calditrichota bacterium]
MEEHKNKGKQQKENQHQETQENHDLLSDSDFENLPPQIKKVVSLSMQRFSGPFPPQFYDKITSEHINKLIEYSEKDDERSYNYAKTSRLFNFLYIIIAVSLFLFLTIFFGKDNQEIYLEIIKFLAVFAGGFGIGYGLKRSRNH